MTRHYHNSPNLPDYFYRQTRALPTRVQYPSREPSRMHSMGSRPVHDTRLANESPPRDDDSERNSNQRRRIAVAVCHLSFGRDIVLDITY